MSITKYSVIYSVIVVSTFVFIGRSESRYVGSSRHLMGILSEKYGHKNSNLNALKNLLPVDHEINVDKQNVAESKHVPNSIASRPELIPNYYKVVVTVKFAKENVDNVRSRLREAFALQLNIPVRNVWILYSVPHLETVDIYIFYTVIAISDNSHAAEDMSILVPASQVMELISLDKLRTYMAPVQVVNIHAKTNEQQNFQVHTSKEEIKVWSLVRDNTWSSWQLPLIVSCALLLIFAIILGIMWLCSRQESRKKLLPLDEPQQVVFQPVHKPVVGDADTVQPENKDSYLTETESENTPSPGRSPLRIKAKGLLERRGSNASLTLDLNRSQENLHCGTPPKECSTEEFLLSAGNRMTRKQLHNCLKDVKALHSEFWEIPMNHPEKVEIPGSGTKNRYKTIMPNWHTRVQLSSEDGDPLSTYINANYVRGYDGEPKAYIATQGPMAHTVDDFWLMVWLEKAPIIVMITKLKEKNKVKCEPYIPEYYGCYGGIEVTIMKAIPRDGYTIRELFLKKGDEVHQVLHFWYTAWPDHKAPSTAKQLLTMSLEVEALRRDNNGIAKGPAIVHCSAGIGRTGCFIATSIGIQQLLEENMIDVLGIVCALRLDRGGMVQTAEQYEFVHQALHLFENTMPEQVGD